jgi:acyl dehydratase
MRLLVTSGMGLAGGLIGAGGELSWPRPTRPGDVLHVESTVLEVTPSRSRPDRGMVTVENLTKTASGDVVQRFVVKMVAVRRP